MSDARCWVAGSTTAVVEDHGRQARSPISPALISITAAVTGSW